MYNRDFDYREIDTPQKQADGTTVQNVLIDGCHVKLVYQPLGAAKLGMLELQNALFDAWLNTFDEGNEGPTDRLIPRHFQR